jgi:FtsP/CotA-like multicopper oxidase with cupredoxin domain
MKRRDFAKTMAGAMGGLALGGGRAWAAVAATGLSDPAFQPKFAYPVPDALSEGFIYKPDDDGVYRIRIGPAFHQAGLVNPGGQPLMTPIWGYGARSDGVYTWPGRTFQVQRGIGETKVVWENALQIVHDHLLPVDTSLHWCYSLPGYTRNSIARDGVPIITHLHGGHTDYKFDGNPEYFYSPRIRRRQVVGPQWENADGFTTRFVYDNDVPAGNLWYHDHALGITRLNVYAGMAGFYFVRDDYDTGLSGNSYGLPAWPYEKAYAIQDRMFTMDGRLFYPAFPGDPFYDDFITGEGAVLPRRTFPGGGPTGLAEFFGDHMVVNGVIWPYEAVEPRNYRLHLLNGCDSRFMVIRFREAASSNATNLEGAGAPLPFHVVGSDQGLASSATQVDHLVVEPGGRYDIVVDFKGLQGSRVIMENIGGDAPFGGDHGDDLDDEDFFPDRQTDRIMAFDVADMNDVADAFNPLTFAGPPYVNTNPVTRTRKVALFEGNDEYGRLQPLLGVAEETLDVEGNTVNGALAWHQPTTENPGVGDTEIWEIYNATGDAHPVHLHLVHFQILDRQDFTYQLEEKVVPQHNGAEGTGYYLTNIQPQGSRVPIGDSEYAEYVENAPKDMVTALPGQITRIKATFDKPGRYVWHCHILSHEDHEMMRVLHVGPGA